MNQLREAARALYHLRESQGWDALSDALRGFSDHEISDLLSCWQMLARPDQLRPDGADKWLIMGGRGSGKTRGGAEDTLDIQEDWGPEYRGLLTSKAYQRDIEGVMLRGESGLIACAQRRGYDLEYVSSKSRVYYPHGGYSVLISADNPEAFRGPQFNHVWADEIAKWQNPVYVWRNIVLALRLKGQRAPVRTTITTTPKRGSAIVAMLLRDEGVRITRARTEDNVANLDADAVADMRAAMGGSSFGRQELDGEFIEGVGAMVDQDTINQHRVKQAPALSRRIISFDPAITDGEESDDHGIVVLGEDRSNPRRAFVLGDHTLARGKPEAAARRVVQLAKEWSATAIVAELNQGGKWIESHLRVAMTQLQRETDKSHFVPIVGVWAKAAKEVRAEPVGALYELGRCVHVGVHAELEKECSTWIPGLPSPNRMDALVHGVTHLLLGERPATLTRYGAM